MLWAYRYVIDPLIFHGVLRRQHDHERCCIIVTIALYVPLAKNQIQPLRKFLTTSRESKITVLAGFTAICRRNIIPQDIALQCGRQRFPSRIIFTPDVHIELLKIVYRSQFTVFVYGGYLINTELGTDEGHFAILIGNGQTDCLIFVNAPGGISRDRQHQSIKQE